MTTPNGIEYHRIAPGKYRVHHPVNTEVERSDSGVYIGGRSRPPSWLCYVNDKCVDRRDTLREAIEAASMAATASIAKGIK